MRKEANSVKTLVVASGNRKKVVELRTLLEPLGFQLRGLDEFPGLPPVEETGTTFAANAALKAIAAAKGTGLWALADDSGLMVDALQGRPGVYSARYAGPGCSDADNNAKLLDELAGVPDEQRGAKFVCHLAMADPSGSVRLSVEGQCRGRIISDRRGTHGFGYDPLFLVPEFHRTFAELSLAVKSQLSHRARAFALLVPALQRLIATEQ